MFESLEKTTPHLANGDTSDRQNYFFICISIFCSLKRVDYPSQPWWSVLGWEGPVP